IGQHLLRVDRRELLNRLQLDDHDAFDQEIDAQPLIEVKTIEFERDDGLPFDAQAAPLQLASQDDLINGFQQPRPQRSMPLQRRIHSLPRDLVDVPLHYLLSAISASPRETTLLCITATARAPRVPAGVAGWPGSRPSVPRRPCSPSGGRSHPTKA